MTITRAARLTVLVTAAALAGCGQGQQQQNAAAPPAVTVANPVQRTVVDQDEYVGRFAAVESVEIRSRLSGYLSAIHFIDGQMVKKGDLLFTIDRRPFQIVLEQMRANLAQARANLAFTEADLQRGQQLLGNKTITEQAYDQRTQAKRVAEAGTRCWTRSETRSIASTTFSWVIWTRLCSWLWTSSAISVTVMGRLLGVGEGRGWGDGRGLAAGPVDAVGC